jgi:hypothetical protein
LNHKNQRKQNKTKEKNKVSLPVIPALRRQKQEDLEFEVSSGYIVRH